MLNIDEVFKGKTIESVDSSACNAWVFYFSDGTQQTIWAECGSSYTSIPYLEIYKAGE